MLTNMHVTVTDPGSDDSDSYRRYDYSHVLTQLKTQQSLIGAALNITRYRLVSKWCDC